MMFSTQSFAQGHARATLKREMVISRRVKHVFSLPPGPPARALRTPRTPTPCCPSVPATSSSAPRRAATAPATSPATTPPTAVSRAAPWPTGPPCRPTKWSRSKRVESCIVAPCCQWPAHRSLVRLPMADRATAV